MWYPCIRRSTNHVLRLHTTGNHPNSAALIPGTTEEGPGADGQANPFPARRGGRISWMLVQAPLSGLHKVVASFHEPPVTAMAARTRATIATVTACANRDLNSLNHVQPTCVLIRELKGDPFDPYIHPLHLTPPFYRPDPLPIYARHRLSTPVKDVHVWFTGNILSVSLNYAIYRKNARNSNERSVH